MPTLLQERRISGRQVERRGVLVTVLEIAHWVQAPSGLFHYDRNDINAIADIIRLEEMSWVPE